MRGTGSTLVSSILILHSVLIGKVNDESFNVPISFPIVRNDKQKTTETEALINSRAEGKFIDQNYTCSLNPTKETLKGA